MGGPDVGFAWAVASAACFMNFIMAGLGRMSGILFVAFIEFFQVDRKRASIPFSARSSARNLFGPVVGILGQKYGARKVIVSGSLIGSVSCILCFFTDDIIWITILWGVINGLGTALTVTLPQVVIGQYFVKHRTTAAGMGFSGGCVGSFLFPVLIEYLIQNFGIEGTFLLIAGIVMHTIPAAIILRKPTWLKENVAKDVKNSSVADNGSFVNNARIETSGKNLNNAAVPDYSFTNGIDNPGMIDEVFPDVGFLKRNSELVVKLFSLPILNVDNSKCFTETNIHEFSIMAVIQNLCQSQTYSKQSSCNLENHSSCIHEFTEPTKRLFYIGDDKEYLKHIADQQYRSFHLQRKPSTDVLPRVHSVPDILVMNDEESRCFVLRKLSALKNVNEQKVLIYFPEAKIKIVRVITELRRIRVPYDKNKIAKNKIFDLKQSGFAKNSSVMESSSPNSNSFAQHIRTAFKLYANPMFLMICICRSVHLLTFVPAITTVVDFAMDKGLKEEDGKYVIAAISLGDLLGRLCLGWITDRGFLPLPKYMMAVMVLQGISTASLPLMHTKITIYANLALFGMLQGSLFVRHPVLVSKYMKKNEQSIAMGCVNFFSGLLGFGLPIYIGFFRDTIGSYDYIFYINGLIGGSVGLLWTLEPLFIRCMNSSGKTTES